jgi:hypothetical protein
MVDSYLSEVGSAQALLVGQVSPYRRRIDRRPCAQNPAIAMLLLILLTQSLGVSLAVRIKQLLAALLPRSLQVRRGDVPIWPAPYGDGAQVLTKIFHGRGQV